MLLCFFHIYIISSYSHWFNPRAFKDDHCVWLNRKNVAHISAQDKEILTPGFGIIRMLLLQGWRLKVLNILTKCLYPSHFGCPKNAPVFLYPEPQKPRKIWKSGTWGKERVFGSFVRKSQCLWWKVQIIRNPCSVLQSSINDCFWTHTQ